MAAAGKRHRRRRAVADMLADGLTTREIAARLGTDRTTVWRDVKALRAQAAPGPGSPVPNAAGPGNARALVHGADHEPTLAPRREHHARDLRRRWPDLDDLRLSVLADRMARLDVATRWLDARGVVRDARGNVYPVVDRVEEWGRRVENIVAQLQADAERRDSPQERARAYVAETYGDGKG